jgi:hypothetical protein
LAEQQPQPWGPHAPVIEETTCVVGKARMGDGSERLLLIFYTPGRVSTFALSLEQWEGLVAGGARAWQAPLGGIVVPRLEVAEETIVPLEQTPEGGFRVRGNGRG